MSNFPYYNTMKFTDIFKTNVQFVEEYSNSQIPSKISTVNANTLYYLLYARFGNNPIANYDINQFKYKIWSIIFQYGPTWEKRLDIQEKLRGLTEKEMMQGAKSISNMALNPDQEPDESQIDELKYVSNQNVNKQTKSVLGAYAELWNLLRIDVTKSFLDNFRPLFRAFVIPDKEYVYETSEE